MNRINVSKIDKFQCKIAVWNRRKLNKLNRVCIGERVRWRVFCKPVSLEEEFSAVKSKNVIKAEECEPENLAEEANAGPLSSQEVRLFVKLSNALALLTCSFTAPNVFV